MKTYLRINEADDVAIALVDLPKGTAIEVGGRTVTLVEDIAKGHKVALHPIAQGDNVIKYGYPIGHATEPIAEGAWIHSHNIKTNLHDNLEYTYAPKIAPKAYPADERTVMGYERKNGDMGIRNELWIIPTVGCVNGQAEAIAKRIRAEEDCSHLDDVRVYTHPYGCSQLGGDHANTRKALAAMVKHPNAGAVLVLGLGCENNQVAEFKQEIGTWDDQRVRFIIAQEVEDEIEEGVKVCR
ncbi:MAG: UxaA family hydrolase, partial [Tidjanibacter sp.]|nr:UxaA family hydrolase [Tidjanibacter sp.]